MSRQEVTLHTSRKSGSRVRCLGGHALMGKPHNLNHILNTLQYSYYTQPCYTHHNTHITLHASQYTHHTTCITIHTTMLHTTMLHITLHASHYMHHTTHNCTTHITLHTSHYTHPHFTHPHFTHSHITHSHYTHPHFTQITLHTHTYHNR